MKATIEVSDPLLEQAERIAARENVTLREIVERGLRLVIEERRNAAPFVLRDARVRGDGLDETYQGASWERIRDAAYEGRSA